MDKAAYWKVKKHTVTMMEMVNEGDLYKGLTGAAATAVWLAEKMGVTREELHATLDREFERNVEASTPGEVVPARSLHVVVPDSSTNEPRDKEE
jgi:hypothetical protein